MMNKPPMGAQPAPSGPPSLNFQSDPNMRSQFKGFMSGMAARNMPAPQPQPAMMMPSMPQQMSSMDIFQPVQAFRRGGGVGRMDYQGAPIAGVTGGTAGSTTSDFGSAASFPQATGRTISGIDYLTQNMSDDGPSLVAALPTAAPGLIDLFGLGLDNRASPNQQAADFLAAADASMPQVDALQEQINRKQQNQAALAQANRNAAMQNASQAIQSVIQGNQATNANVAAIRDADMDLLGGPLDTGPESQDAYEQRLAAEYITSRGGNVTVDPMTGQVSGDIDQIFDIDTTFAPYEIDGISAPQNLPSAPPSRPARELPALGVIGDEDVYGIGEFGEMGVAPRPEPESALDRAARKDDMSGARQLVQRGFGAGTDPMAQLQARSEREIFETDKMLPGIGAALAGLANSLGQGTSNRLMERIQAGGIPEYDNTGQIVGAYMPGGGLFGSTVFFGPEEFRNDARMRQIAKDFGEQSRAGSDYTQASSGEDDPVNPFLRLLGFEEGGEVPTPFRAGGGVGRQDYEGGTMSGVTGDVAGSSTSDVGSSQSLGQQASGRSFSGADLYGGDDGGSSVQTVLATPVSEQQNTVSGGQIAPQSQDVVPATVPEGEFLQPTQAPAQQPMSVRDRIAAVSEQSQPTFSSLLGDLFDFSSPTEAPMSDIERIQGEIAIAKAKRGEDFYGQNLGLTPAQTQAYSQAGMAVSPAATLQRGVSGGQRVNVPVSARYEKYNPTAAGVQKGVQMKGELLGLGGRYN